MADPRVAKDDLIERITGQQRLAGVMPKPDEAATLVDPIIERALRKSEEKRIRDLAKRARPAPGQTATTRRELGTVKFRKNGTLDAPDDMPRGTKFRAAWVTSELPPSRWVAFLQAIPDEQRRNDVAVQIWIHCLRELPEWRAQLERIWLTVPPDQRVSATRRLINQSKVALSETWMGQRIAPLFKV